MSWSDLRCLHCDGRLPLYRKITDGQFCSSAHRKAYWQEQERLALERLHQTHNSLKVYVPPQKIEAILGPYEAEEEAAPPQAGLLPDTLQPWADRSPALVASDPVEYEMWFAPRRPLWDAPGPPLVGACVAGAVAVPLADVAFANAPAPSESGLSAIDPEAPAPVRVTLKMPPLTAEIERFFEDHVPAPAGLRAIEFQFAPAAAPAVALPELATLESAPETPSRKNRGRRSGAKKQQGPIRFPWSAAPEPQTMVAVAGCVEMPCGNPAGAAPVSARDQIAIIEMQAGQPATAVEFAHTVANDFRPAMASGCRYNVRAARAACIALESAPIEFTTSRVETHTASPIAVAITAAGGTSARSIRFAAHHMLALNVAPTVQDDPSVARSAADAVELPQPVKLEPHRPHLRLEPIDAKPVEDSIPQGLPVPPSLSAPAATNANADRLHHLWSPIAGFWRNAPRDLKLMACAIPVLLGIVLNPALPKVHVSAASTNEIQRSFKRSVNAKWGDMKHALGERAAIALNEDFRQGLDEWVSRDEATATWAFDNAGFVKPQALALYRPSLTLVDYQMQFLGMIDKKAISWVVRATDYNNYYVVKLVVLKSGPVPVIGLTRYAVVNGVADERVDSIVPVDARKDTLYRVVMELDGPRYSLAVQGQMIDAWTEERLQRGGVGFFSPRDEESRLRWVQVTHQYDMLGKLCAFLAPYDPNNSNGGMQ